MGSLRIVINFRAYALQPSAALSERGFSAARESRDTHKRYHYGQTRQRNDRIEVLNGEERPIVR
ncbi:MAG: hypothetical protein CMQ45_07750 [Gammaproteobacteria bacterium]|nr:hypothetical protein [Gammaproteobacteria bacterium]